MYSLAVVCENIISRFLNKPQCKNYKAMYISIAIASMALYNTHHMTLPFKHCSILSLLCIVYYKEFISSLTNNW